MFPLNPRIVPLAIGLAALGFAAYGSLIPFDFQRLSLSEAAARFQLLVVEQAPDRVSRTDLLANVLLFVPVGFGLTGALLFERAGRLRVPAVILAVLATSVAASVTIEFLQIYTVDRVPSSRDIAAQGMGCAAGIALWLLVGAQLTRWVAETAAAEPGARVPRLILAYACGWVLVNLAPFDITVDVGDLAARVASGKISLVPFAGTDTFSIRWTWDALAEVLAALPLGLLGLLSGRRSVVVAATPGLALVLCVEVAHVVIRSHAASATDALFGSLGVALGVVASRRIRVQPAEHPSTVTVDVRALALVVAAVLLQVAYHWQPFDFAVDRELVREKLRAVSLVPFSGYQGGSYLNALNTLLTKLALPLPVGLAAAFAIRAPAEHGRLLLGGCLALSFLLFAVIEAGQFFLPSRYPDLTDVILGALSTGAGAGLGVWIQQHRRP